MSWLVVVLDYMEGSSQKVEAKGGFKKVSSLQRKNVVDN